ETRGEHGASAKAWPTILIMMGGASVLQRSRRFRRSSMVEREVPREVPELPRADLACLHVEGAAHFARRQVAHGDRAAPAGGALLGGVEARDVRVAVGEGELDHRYVE